MSDCKYKSAAKLVLWLLCLVMLKSQLLLAQELTPPLPGDGKKVLKSDFMERITLLGQDIRRHVGNVSLTQEGEVLTCDSAIEYLGTPQIQFLGRVKITKSDGVTLSTDKLNYNKDSRIAICTGNVLLIDGLKTLKTPELFYDMLSGRATYYNGGDLSDGPSKLKSRFGTYNRNSGKMGFRGNVELRGENGNLNTDSLDYDSKEKMAWFYGPSVITNEDGVLQSEKGRYNTETGQSWFDSRSIVDNKDYKVIANIIRYNKVAKKGYLFGDVVLFGKKDSLTVTGQEGDYEGGLGYTKIWGGALAKMPMDKKSKDTLYLRADTLHSKNMNDSNATVLLAYRKVKIYQRDLQAISDSLAYHKADSMIHLFYNPAVWSGNNQMTADSIRFKFGSQQIKRMWLKQNAFCISVDTLKNYNQLKGKSMEALFDSNSLKTVYVWGNGHSLYFPLEGDSVTVGMNKVLCSKMTLRFGAKSKLKNISFIQEPDAKFIPPHEILEPEKKLKGFVWRLDEKPTIETITGYKLKKIEQKEKPRTEPKKLRKTKIKKKRTKVKSKI